MDHQTVNCYQRDAAEFAARYESADMAVLHSTILSVVPKGARVLEVGCGSGRDAAYMLKHGYEVAACDASSEMLRVACGNHPELVGRVHHSALPFNKNDPILAKRFDAVIAVAVAMHLSDDDLALSAQQFRDVLAVDGVMLMSASTRRESIKVERDPEGRLFVERTPDQLESLFEPAGFVRTSLSENSDSFGRKVQWYTMVLKRTGGTR